MQSLETKIKREVSSLVREGLDCCLIRTCRKKSSRLGSNIFSQLKANEIPWHIESYKSRWNELEILSANPNSLSSANFCYLNDVVDKLKTERRALLVYAHPNRVERGIYLADRKISQLYGMLPIWAKLLLFA